MSDRIPPHILWPGIIILLILSNIIVAVTTYRLANKDGGVTMVNERGNPTSTDSTPTDSTSATN